MESLLNVTWVVFVAVTAACWLANDQRPRATRAFWLRLLAFVCAAFILFPIISVSDDLHPERYVAEDARSAKQRASAVSCAVPIGPAIWPGMAIVAALLKHPPRSAWLTVVSLPISYRAPLFARLTRGRAPPFELAS